MPIGRPRSLFMEVVKDGLYIEPLDIKKLHDFTLAVKMQSLDKTIKALSG